MMNSRKWKKLKTNPKQFFADSKFNIISLMKGKKTSNLVEMEIKNPKERLHNEADYSPVNHNYQEIKPIISENFNFSYLISNLNKSTDITGVFITPVSNELKPALCVLNSQKENFFKSFLTFLFQEGINIAYKYNKEVKKPKTVQSLWMDVHNLKHFDIRLSTNRVLGKQNASFWFRLEFLDESENTIVFPVNNHISRRLYKHTITNTEIFKKGILNYADILSYPFEQAYDFDVDLVFTWVNSDDPDWKELYSQYKPEFNSDASSTSRFLSRDELKYSLRSWEKYGNFIRKIFIVSNCAPPEWLDLNNPKINWIWHEEIIPNSALPTFSSHAIEACLHNIKGLSNYWIYCNDDILLLRPSNVGTFFHSNGIAKLRLEEYGNVNGSPNEADPDYMNAARNVNVLLEKKFRKTPTQLHTHSPQSMRNDVLKEMNEEFQQDFDRTISHKFRDISDISVTSYFYQHYALLSGRALPSSERTELIVSRHNYKKKFNDIIKLYKANDTLKLPISICINDGADSYLDQDWNNTVIKFLNELFPLKSSFEKE